jgi:putative sterol carrier protein
LSIWEKNGYLAYWPQGRMELVKHLYEGKIGTAMALLKNRIKLRGSKLEALKIIKQLDGLIEALRTITDEFEQ